MKNLVKYMIFIYPLAVGVASLILIFFVIVPQLQGFLSGQENVSSARIRLNNLDAKAATLANFDQKAYTEKLLAAFSSLPVDQDLSAIVGIFQNLTTSAGMALSNLRVGGEEEGNSYSVTAEVVGPANNLSLLLDVVDNSPRVMKLVTLDTNPAGGDLVNATISVNVFYAPAPDSLGLVDTPLPELTEEDQAILTSLTVPGSVGIPEPVLLPSGKSNPFE